MNEIVFLVLISIALIVFILGVYFSGKGDE